MCAVYVLACVHSFFDWYPLQAGNQTATIVALCSLLDFDLKQDTSQMAIRDVGGMDLLVNLLETNDLKCRIGALKIMTELTQNAQTRIDITNLGGTYTVGATMCCVFVTPSSTYVKCWGVCAVILYVWG